MQQLLNTLNEDSTLILETFCLNYKQIATPHSTEVTDSFKLIACCKSGCSSLGESPRSKRLELLLFFLYQHILGKKEIKQREYGLEVLCFIMSMHC